MEVYRASIENEVCRPAFATEKLAHEQNTRLAVRWWGSVADKQVFCEGVLPFEVAAGRQTEFSISSDNLHWGNSRGKICHWVLYGILRSAIVILHPNLWDFDSP